MEDTICHSEYSKSSTVPGVYGGLLWKSLRGVIRRIYMSFFSSGGPIPGNAASDIIWNKVKVHRNKYFNHSSLQKFFG